MQWAKCARTAASNEGKIPLFINMDETSVGYNYGKGKGLVVSKHVLPPGRKHRREPVNTSDTKTHISFLAFVTHDPTIQPKLPQIFIGNKHKFTLTLLRGLFAKVPKGYYLWREDSSWNNNVLMCKAMRLLAKHLKDYSATHKIILILDVARCHRHHTFFSLAQSLGIILMYVPAKLTWLLQPADTHVFARLKKRLRQLWLDLRVERASGEVSHHDWLVAVLELLRKLLCGFQWHSAFLSDGLLDDSRIGSRLLDALGWAAPKLVPNGILTAEQLKGLMPRRTKDAHAHIFSWALPKAKAKASPKAKAKAKAKAKGLPAALATHPGPISSGTRSKRKSHAIG